MARMIDQIRAGGALTAPFVVAEKFAYQWERHARRLVEILKRPELPVLVIDNVSDYYYTGTDQEHWDLVKDFPNLAPPYPQFWAEHRMVRKIHSKEKGDSDMSALVGPNGRVGVLVSAADPADCRAESVPTVVRERAKWYLWCELFVHYDYAGPKSERAEQLRRAGVVAEGPHGSIFMVVDENGVLLEKPWLQAYLPEDATELDHEVLKALLGWLHPTLLAISFLHCKNVRVEDHAMDKPLAKKFRARHNCEPARWKTLVIEPLKQILRTEGKSGTVGVAKAMHICRGHFRDYREGRGLFGKYHGQFWQPSHVKGTKGKLGPREVEVKVPVEPPHGAHLE